MKKIFLFLAFSLFVTGKILAQSTTLFAYGSNWKYWANSQANAPAAEWNGSGTFNDAGWPSGPSKLGFGGDGEVTCIPAGCGSGCTPGSCGSKFTTTYFRTTVNIANVNLYVGYRINLVRDDGAVVYVNGQEVWRTNMPAGSISYATFASTVDGGTQNQIHSSPVIPVSAFQDGSNLIAIELHQASSTSSDLGMNMELLGLAVIPVNEVVYMWSGALTTTSAKVNAKLSSPTTQARLAVSTSSSMSSPVYGAYTSVSDLHNMMAALSITGLSPNTKYYYAVEADGQLDNSADDIGTFTTINTGQISYRFTVGGCALSSNHPVYTRMGEKNPLFFVALGDFHYSNPNSASDINVHRLPYENNMLSQPASQNFFKSFPFAYIWDDHDFSGNDSDSTAAGKTNARLAYQEYVPHYPLPRGSGNVPIYQSFSAGRIHFVMTDLRSTRRLGSVIWDAAQKQWFKDECLYAKNNNLVIAWVSSVSFGGTGADNWGGFTADRTEISNFLRDNEIQNMFILSGDAHMVAIDNGANHDFSTGNNNVNDYPVFGAAALNQTGGNKGGNYNVKSDGTVDLTPGANYVFPNPSSADGQYGVVDVSDNGFQICASFTAYRVNNAGVETQLTSFNFCRSAGGALPIYLSSFSAKEINQAVELNWEVSEQSNCSSYTIEKSTDGLRFTQTGITSCHSESRYSFTDAYPFKGKNYYRIKMMETTGRISYSEVRIITLDFKTRLVISPNPVKGNIESILADAHPGKISYSIYDIHGRKYINGNFGGGGNRYRIPIKNLKPGAYALQVNDGTTTVTKLFLVQ